MNKRIEFFAVIGTLVLGLAPRIIVLCGSAEMLVQFIPDDAFYYFQIARNIAAGQGSTLDGIHPTNGYHPLWMFLLVPFAALAHDPDTLVRCALAVAVLFNVAAALLLYALLRRLTANRVLALIGMGFYFLNSQAVLSSLDGLETALSSLLFVLALYLVLNREDEDRWSTLLLGLVLGLLFLARTDNLFFIGAFLIVYLLKSPERLWRGLPLVLVILAVAAPWLAWNWVYFGSPIQQSGLATPYVLHESFIQSGNTSGQVLAESAIKFAAFLLVGSRYFLGAIPILFEATLLYCLLLFHKRWHSSRVTTCPRLQRALAVIVALWLGGLVLIFSHTFVRWFPRTWYFDPLIILSAVTCCVGFTLVELPRLWTSPRVRWALVSTLATVGLALYVVSEAQTLVRAPFGFQVELLDAANWLRANVGHDQAAAAFNAGIISFYSERRVVNLDGVVNSAAYRALVQKDLSRLMQESRVGYYADFDPVMLRDYALFLGDAKNQGMMKIVKDCQRPGIAWEDSVVRIYRLDWEP